MNAWRTVAALRADGAPEFAAGIENNLLTPGRKPADRAALGSQFELVVADAVLSAGFRLRDPSPFIDGPGTFDAVLRCPRGCDLAAVEITATTPAVVTAFNATPSLRRSVETRLASLEKAAADLASGWCGANLPYFLREYLHDHGLPTPDPATWVARTDEPDPYPQAPVPAVGWKKLRAQLCVQAPHPAPSRLPLQPFEAVIREHVGGRAVGWRVSWWSTGVHDGTNSTRDRASFLRMLASRQVGRAGSLIAAGDDDVSRVNKVIRDKARKDQWGTTRLPRVLVAGIDNYVSKWRLPAWEDATEHRGRWAGGSADVIAIVPSSLAGRRRAQIISRDDTVPPEVGIAVGRALGVR